MYWFLVMHKEFGATKGDIGVVKGKSIGAAPWVEMGLRRLLTEAGIDLERDGVTIAPVPGSLGAGVNFGVTAAKALEDRKIDGFWANGMGAEVAVKRGVGTVVLDVRRGDGPKPCFNYTMASIATTDALIERSPETAAAAVRAHRQDAGGAEGRSVTRHAGRPQAVSAVGGRIDRRTDPPRPAVLRRVDLARFRRRHEPVRARHRHPQGRGAVRARGRDAVCGSVEIDTVIRLRELGWIGQPKLPGRLALATRRSVRRR